MNNFKPFIFFLGIGVALSILFSSGQIENPDTHLRLSQTRYLLDDFHFGLPDDVGEDGHGNVAINKRGQRFMVYNPGQSLFFIPIYGFSNLITNNEGKGYYLAAFFVSFVNFILHALSAFLLFKLSLKLGATEKKAFFTSLVFCFTSYSFSFAQSTYEHHFEMFFILLGFFLIMSQNVKQNSLLAGIAIGFGLLFRNTTILAIPGILLLIGSNRQRIAFLLGTIPCLLVILFYNYYRFENPFESGYSIAWQLAHGANFEFWSWKKIPSSFIGFLVSPAKGLLVFSPTIILGLLGIKKFWAKQSKFCMSVIVFIGIYLVLLSMNFAWHGSIWSFGPRYILPIVPFLYLPLMELKIKKWVYLFLLIAVFSQVLLISVNYKRELLEQHLKYKSIDNNMYIFNVANIPYAIQLKQLIYIVPKNFKGELVNHYPRTPWKKEIRTASGENVLEWSIENNAINFWYFRNFFLKQSTLDKVASIIVLLFSIVLCLFLYRNAKEIFN